ncbi:uncharacterized protein LOC115661802 [Syzygium oleosum]|uniref:uncharacterized protein LOC115661802 n=1 Tax=Syzygium oleosum TaxID=219896 RepID=UPI0024BA72DC|nr:uncharacterized protein LOC115661802 [Syzygium oleosum]
MGNSDIRLILPPKKELNAWWDKLDRAGREFVELTIGRLLPLLRINIHGGLIQALAHCWCPETTTFIFGKHELTPTLEEYSIAIGKPLELELISPPIGINPVSILSDFLRIKEEKIRKILKGHRNTCPFSFLDECFQNGTSFQMRRIFLLAFFGFILFPHCKNAINPLIAKLVGQVCGGMNFVNALLAETFLSLSRFKENGDKIFRASPELLQIWFLSHLKGFGGLMIIREVSNSDHPIMRFENKQKHAPDYHYSNWLAFFKNPKSKCFLWHAKWFQVREARLTCGRVGPIPLLGFTGAMEYYPTRVTRQYQVVQELPPALKQADSIRVDFTDGDLDHDDSISLIKSLWDMCHPQMLIWPEKELEGKERKYYATAEYIRRHKIPDNLLPKIPMVPEKITNRAEKRCLKRKAEKLQEQVTHLAKENKRLRLEITSQLYIDQAK